MWTKAASGRYRPPSGQEPTLLFSLSCLDQGLCPWGDKKRSSFLGCFHHLLQGPWAAPPGKEPPHEGIPWEGAAQLADSPQGAVRPLLACPGGFPRPGVVRPPHHLNSASPQALSPTPQAYLPLGVIIFILFVLFSYKA